MKPRIKSMIWNIRKENQSIGTRKKNPKNEDSVRYLQNISKCTNIHTIGMPEGEEEEQNIENLFEKNNKRELL